MEGFNRAEEAWPQTPWGVLASQWSWPCRCETPQHLWPWQRRCKQGLLRSLDKEQLLTEGSLENKSWWFSKSHRTVGDESEGFRREDGSRGGRGYRSWLLHTISGVPVPAFSALQRGLPRVLAVALLSGCFIPPLPPRAQLLSFCALPRRRELQ